MTDHLSTLIVKGALAVLVLFSIATWTIVLLKSLQGGRARRQDAQFLGSLDTHGGFPAGERLSQAEGPAARLALAASTAWDANGSLAEGRLEVSRDILERSLKRQIQKERRREESGLALLASVGSTSPFVGLFGTVWGIMHALKRISGAGSASLDVVAGPIGEALVATGVGIAVAVPAVLAYNYFVRRLKVHAADLEDLANGFVTAALRSLLERSEEPGSGAHRVSELADTRSAAQLLEARA